MLDVSKIRLFLFDMDGTLYLGEQLFPFTRKLLQEIRRQGKEYRFMTNNSSRSATDYVRKMERLGIPAVEADFVTSAQVTADYLVANLPDRVFYVAGTRSLARELAEAGLQVTQRRSKRVNAVVIGFDSELTFRKIDDMSRLLRQPDMPFIATHPDVVCPTEYGSVPDCGAVCEMLYQATGRRPIVIGKPEPMMPQRAMRELHATPEETLVIGDRLNTDIESGLRAGTRTLLVFSGEATPEAWRAAARKPDEAWQDCGVLLQALREGAGAGK